MDLITQLILFCNNLAHLNRSMNEEEVMMYLESCRLLTILLKRARIAHENVAEHEENENNDPPETS